MDDAIQIAGFVGFYIMMALALVPAFLPLGRLMECDPKATLDDPDMGELVAGMALVWPCVLVGATAFGLVYGAYWLFCRVALTIWDD